MAKAKTVVGLDARTTAPTVISPQPNKAMAPAHAASRPRLRRVVVGESGGDIGRPGPYGVGVRRTSGQRTDRRPGELRARASPACDDATRPARRAV